MSSDDEALREKIAQALHGSRCGVAWEASHGPAVYDHRHDARVLAAAVLPVVKEITDENKALRQKVSDYLLTHIGGDETESWQAGHNYAMREAARLVREEWDAL